MNNKKLYRSLTDKKLCGVCGGLGDYFEIDSTVVRLLWIIFTFCGGAGLLAYIVCALIVPKQDQMPNP
jgi:phage shock protein C